MVYLVIFQFQSDTPSVELIQAVNQLILYWLLR